MIAYLLYPLFSVQLLINLSIQITTTRQYLKNIYMIVYNKLYLLINHVIIVLCIYDKKKTLQRNQFNRDKVAYSYN